jgi:hypothetical protein
VSLDGAESWTLVGGEMTRSGAARYAGVALGIVL